MTCKKLGFIKTSLILAIFSLTAVAQADSYKWTVLKTFKIRGNVKSSGELIVRPGQAFKLEMSGGERIERKKCIAFFCNEDHETKYKPTTFTAATASGKVIFLYGNPENTSDDSSYLYYHRAADMKQSFNIAFKFRNVSENSNYRSEVRECQVLATCSDSRWEGCTYAMGTQTVELHDQSEISQGAAKITSMSGEVLATAKLVGNKPYVSEVIDRKGKCILNVP